MACSDFEIPQQLKFGKVLTGQKQEKLWRKGGDRATQSQPGVYIMLQQGRSSLELMDVTKLLLLMCLCEFSDTMSNVNLYHLHYSIL